MRLNQTFAQGKENRSALYLAFELSIRKLTCESSMIAETEAA
jgi:hypothetical protein